MTLDITSLFEKRQIVFSILAQRFSFRWVRAVLSGEVVKSRWIGSNHAAMEQQPIDLKSLEEAVVLFYRSEAAQQAAAHNWLTEAQASSQAWQFAWELMRPDKVIYSLNDFDEKIK